MIYRLVEIDTILSRLDNDFNINQGDWINRVPQWSYQCLNDLNIRLGHIPKAHIAEVENNYSYTPDDVHQLIGIEYNGGRLDRRATTQYARTKTLDSSFATIKTNVGITVTGTLKDVTLDDTLEDIVVNVDKVRVYDASTINELPLSNHHYYLHPNGKIETSFEEGIIVYHYYTLPYKYSETINSNCPLVPDNEHVQEALTWYMFQSILQRGTKHPVFTLGNPNPVLDPFKRYRAARLSAKVKSKQVDSDQAKIQDRMWQSVLYNTIARER